MNGFGKDLKQKKYTGKLYHSCTVDGLANLLFDYNGESVNFSTEASTKLFGRECVIVINVENIDGLYAPFDADAGKNYGYDEFRAKFQPGRFEFPGEYIFYVISDIVMTWAAFEKMEDNEGLVELAYRISRIVPVDENSFWNVT